MTPQGHPAADPRAIGASVYPRLVGALVLCGWPSDAAAVFVRGRVAHAVHGGLMGGTAAPALLVEDVLDAASPPAQPRPPADEVEAALAALPWDERIATVAVEVFGTRRLGDGQAAVVAQALGATTDPWAPPEQGKRDLPGLLAEAVAARSPAPEPDLLERLTEETVRRNRWIAVAVIVGILVVFVVAVLAAAALARSRPEPAPARADGSSPYAITQWVAVLETGPTPASLAPRARELGRVVGVHVFTDRWECYEGFDAGQLDDQPWFLGIGAVERDVVDRLVEAAGVEVLLEAQVRQVCVQPPPTPDVPVLSVSP